MSKQHTELLRKFIKDYHSNKPPATHPQPPPPHPTHISLPLQPSNSSNPHSDSNLLQQKLRKRQSTIQKLYKRSVVNKIYIFPRLQERLEDVLSLSSHSSIQEMEATTTYKLGEQNKRRGESSGERFLREYKQSREKDASRDYRSQHADSTDQIDRKYLKKVRKRVESSKLLQGTTNRDQSKDSGRIMAYNNASGASIKHPAKKHDSQLSARPQTNPPDSAKHPKSKKQAYQQLLQRLQSKSKDQARTRHNKSNSITTKPKPTTKKPPTQRQPFSNICITKILDKYTQFKYAKKSGRDDRCQTEY